MVPRILIVLVLPENENECVSCMEEQLILKGMAFWKNLRGFPMVENESNKTVTLSKKNQLEVFSLEEMMILLSKGEEIPYEF